LALRLESLPAPGAEGLLSDDFYTGFLHLENYRPTLGVDTTSADGRSFEVDGAYWEQQVSDYMMRAVVVLR